MSKAPVAPGGAKHPAPKKSASSPPKPLEGGAKAPPAPSAGPTTTSPGAKAKAKKAEAPGIDHDATGKKGATSSSDATTDAAKQEAQLATEAAAPASRKPDDGSGGGEGGAAAAVEPPLPSHETPLPPAIRKLLNPNDYAGHKDFITCAAVDMETDRLVCGSRDNTAGVFDLATGEKIATLQHDDWVNGAVFCEITMQTGFVSAAKKAAEDPPHGGGNDSHHDIAATGMPGGGSGSKASDVRRQAKSFYKAATLDLTSTVDGASFRLVVTATEDGYLTWWGSKYCVTHQMRLSHAALTKMSIHAGVLMVLSLESIFLVSSTLRCMLRQIRVNSEPLSLAATADGCSLYCGHLDGFVGVYDAPQVVMAKRFSIVDGSPVRGIAIDSSCSYVYCGCDEGIVGVYSIGMAQLLRSFAPHRSLRPNPHLAIHDLLIFQVPVPLPRPGVPRPTSTPEFALIVATASRDGTVALTNDHSNSTAVQKVTYEPRIIPSSLKPSVETPAAAAASSVAPIRNAPQTPFSADNPALYEEEAAPTFTTIIPFCSMANCILTVTPVDPVTDGPAVGKMYLVAGEVDGRIVRFELFPAALHCC